MIPVFKRSLITLILLASTAVNAQYLGYSEMMEVLEKARDTSAVSGYLTARGFLLNSVDNGEPGYNILYEAVGTDDEYFVGLYEERENAIFNVIEYTRNASRWDEYIRATKRNDFMLTGMKDHGAGVTSFKYMKGETLMSLWIFKEEDGIRYQFSISKELPK